MEGQNNNNIELNRIAEVLSEKGISGYALCQKLDCSQGTVQFWKTNQSQPTIKMLKRICDVLGCKSSDLLTF